jgi:XTP/dITP diphosphohydrolase
MNAAQELVLGTHNRMKAKELKGLLGGCGFQLRGLDEYPSAIVVVEDGDSLAANAAKKASEQARHLGQWVLGEDSGLVVDALDGAPGILSARFSGPQATDESNNRYLLEQLRAVALDRRTASYVCHLAVADPEGRIRAQGEGRCRGSITRAPAGTSGFGYDPLFEIVEYHRTFAELGETVKSILSHRARAVRQLLPKLLCYPSSFVGPAWRQGEPAG